MATCGLLREDNTQCLALMSYKLQGFRLTTVMALDGHAAVMVTERAPIELQTPIMNDNEPFVSKAERFMASALRAH